jgi:hypothetical protein
MNKQILTVVTALSLSITWSVAAFAGLAYRVKANIPFDFMVGGNKLAAGEYTVERINTVGVLAIRSLDTKSGVQFMTMNGNSKDDTAKLVFRRYGDQYFLAQIHDGASSGAELIKSKAEREAARAGRDHLALNNAGPEIVTVTARVGQ